MINPITIDEPPDFEDPVVDGCVVDVLVVLGVVVFVFVSIIHLLSLIKEIAYVLLKILTSLSIWKHEENVNGTYHFYEKKFSWNKQGDLLTASTFFFSVNNRMEKNAADKFFTPKTLIVGFGIIAIIGLLFIVINASQTAKVAPTPTPAPPAQTQVPIATMPPIPPDKQVQGKIMVQFKAGMTDEQINEQLKQYNASVISKIQGINYVIVKVPNGQENTIIEQLKKNPMVQNADGDYTTHIMYVPNDPGFTQQWGMKNTGQSIGGQAGTANDDIKAEQAWDVSKGAGVKVAILDTGINLNHPDLASKVVAQSSFVGGTVEDGFGHGTHVAGILSADTGNSVGVAGTCPSCQLIIGKVLDDTGKGDSTNAISAITWAADQGAKVISMSLGTVDAGAAASYQTAINYAISKGAVIVAAAGNCGDPSTYALNGCTVLKTGN